LEHRHSNRESIAISSEQGRCCRRLVRILAALTIFGIAFSYVEAAVVVYLRVSYEPLHQRLYPERSADDLFPIICLDQLEAAGPEYKHRLYIELGREAATIIMLAGVALAIARNRREWLAAFMVAFGIWDILFYVFLRFLVNWPASLFDWDLLFLLPVPWVGPVAAPLFVSLTIVAAGIVILRRESLGLPVRVGTQHWASIFVGGALIILAFCWDYRNIMAGGLPHAFHWPLFVAGGLLGILSFLHGLKTYSFSLRQTDETLPDGCRTASLQ
jgi:hypothetical protein